MTQELIASAQPITAATAEAWTEAESASAAAIEALFESIDSLGALNGMLTWDARGDGLAALNWDHELLAVLAELGDGLEMVNSNDDALALLLDERGDGLDALDFNCDLLGELFP